MDKAKRMERIETIKAKERMGQGTPTLAEQGEVRDIVADKSGFGSSDTLNKVNSPRSPGYTEEEMERRLILGFNKLSPYDQAEILTWAECALEKHVKAVAKKSHLHLVKNR